MKLLLFDSDLREDRSHVTFEQAEYGDFNAAVQIGIIAVGSATYAERKEGERPNFKKIFPPKKLERDERIEL